MTAHSFTTDEKIAEVERLIEVERHLTGRRNDVLAAVAADLRARLEGKPSAALHLIERRIASLSRRAIWSDQVGPKVGVAEEVIARWPVIKQALERFGAAIEHEG